MPEWRAPGVLRWDAARDLVRAERNPELPDLWGHPSRPGIIETRAEYEAMGLVLYQVRQLQVGLEQVAAIARGCGALDSAGRGPRPAIHDLHELASLAPHLLTELSASYHPGPALLDGWRWALDRGEQLLGAEAVAGFTWQAFRDQQEHVLTIFWDSSVPERLLPTWRDAGHQCRDDEVEVDHLHEDLGLMQELVFDLACIADSLSEGLVGALADDPFLPPDNSSSKAEAQLQADQANTLDEARDAIITYLQDNLVLWPARGESGGFRPPPLRHLLDERVRNYHLADSDAAVLRPPAYTCSVAVEALACDWCSREARVDGWAVTDDGGKTAGFLCLNCFALRTDGTLGPGRGAYLFRPEEIPLLVRDVCNELCHQQGREPVYPQDREDPTTAEPLPAVDVRADRADSLLRGLAEELEERQREAEQLVGEFRLGDDGKFIITQAQHERYLHTIRRAEALKRLPDAQHSDAEAEGR